MQNQFKVNEIRKVINGLKNVVRMKLEIKNPKWAKEEVKQRNQNASPKFISSQTFQKHMQSLMLHTVSRKYKK